MATLRKSTAVPFVLKTVWCLELSTFYLPMCFSLNTYNQNELTVSVCGKICLAKNEVFEYLEIYNDASDGRRVDYVSVIPFKDTGKVF